MAGYWPSSFFASLWTETESRSINSQKGTRPISSYLDRTNLVKKVFILWLSGKFFLRDTAGSPERTSVYGSRVAKVTPFACVASDESTEVPSPDVRLKSLQRRFFLVPIVSLWPHSEIVTVKDTERTTKVTNLIIWLAPWAGKMNQILHCDWLSKQAR